MLKEVAGALVASYGLKLLTYSRLSIEEKREKLRALCIPPLLDMIVEDGDKVSDIYLGLFRRKPVPSSF